MRKGLLLSVLGLALTAAAGPVSAQLTCNATNPSPAGDCSLTNTVSGTVNDMVQLTISSNTTVLPAFTLAEFNAGKRTGVSGPTLTVNANRAWRVSIKGAAFTGTGNNAKPVGELRWKDDVDNTSYAGLTTSAVPFFPGAGNGSATNSMVRNIGYEWLLSFATDTPGGYSQVVTFTLSAP